MPSSLPIRSTLSSVEVQSSAATATLGRTKRAPQTEAPQTTETENSDEKESENDDEESAEEEDGKTANGAQGDVDPTPSGSGEGPSPPIDGEASKKSKVSSLTVIIKANKIWSA